MSSAPRRVLPPLRELAPHPNVFCSSTATRAPACASTSAAFMPVKPPPTIATSTRSGSCAHTAILFGYGNCSAQKFSVFKNQFPRFLMSITRFHGDYYFTFTKHPLNQRAVRCTATEGFRCIAGKSPTQAGRAHFTLAAPAQQLLPQPQVRRVWHPQPADRQMHHRQKLQARHRHCSRRNSQRAD